MGTAGRMGPAYFPTILGGLLAVIGAISVGRSMFRSGDPIERIAIKNLLIILLAVVLFGLLVRGAGLAIAVIVLVIVSRRGHWPRGVQHAGLRGWPWLADADPRLLVWILRSRHGNPQ
jgi:hypothetical protein